MLYFIRHSLEVYKDHGRSSKTEIAAFILLHEMKKKKQHSNANWFGMYAIVCDDCSESQEACCFMPVQRIANKCAFAKFNMKFDGYENSVFVACPIPIKS